MVGRVHVILINSKQLMYMIVKIFFNDFSLNHRLIDLTFFVIQVS